MEYRMYFFVPYNISPIQQGIQAGHAALRYALHYGKNSPDDPIWDFIAHWETWIVLNGGTTNGRRDLTGKVEGSLNQIADQLAEEGIPFTYFIEPDLNDALTALCLICDERVFNREDYPDFVDWLLNIKMHPEAAEETKKNSPALWVEFKLHPEKQQQMFPEYYKEWIDFIGGEKNYFLRELIRDKKKA